MQVAPIASAHAAAAAPVTPSEDPVAPVSPERQAAAQALVEVPGAVIGVATFVAMQKQMAGETTAAPAELVAPIVAEEGWQAKLTGALDTAVAGAKELMPEQEAAFDAAAEAGAMLIGRVEQLATMTEAVEIDAAMETLQGVVMTPFATILAAAQLLDPAVGQEQGGEQPPMA